MAFEFRLDRVLQHRQYLLDQAQHGLMAARKREQQAKERLQELEHRIREDHEQWLRAQGNGMDVATFLSYKDHIHTLEQRLPAFEKEWQTTRGEVEKQQQVVLEREMAVRILEKLKERYREDYLVESARRDQKKLDESVILKSHRGTEEV